MIFNLKPGQGQGLIVIEILKGVIVIETLTIQTCNQVLLCLKWKILFYPSKISYMKELKLAVTFVTR